MLLGLVIEILTAGSLRSQYGGGALVYLTGIAMVTSPIASLLLSLPLPTRDAQLAKGC
jgi:hypothetical protein